MQNGTFITRREFIRGASLGLCCLAAPDFCRLVSAEEPHSAKPEREVMFYTKLDNLKIQCGICPKKCIVPDGQRGYCGNKENRKGQYYCLAYSHPCQARLDPVEKKPFFHYLPSSRVYSIGTTGCNLNCRYCQNWQLARSTPEQIETIYLPPDMVVQKSVEADASAIAYTYTEPTIFYDYMFESARKGAEKGLGNIMISNGYINPEPLKKLCKHLSAVKIDLKSFSDSFYRTYCDASLEPVLNTLKNLKDIGIWFEIVALIIPALNDSPDEIKQMCAWIDENLGENVPLHFTRFYPAYKMKDIKPTPVETLERCHGIAKKQGLNYVYIGNVANHPLLSTYCPNCGKMLIKRIGFDVVENHITDSRCPGCKTTIPGVWS